MWLEPVRLTGSLVVLEPLTASHAEHLAAAVQDGALWQLWYTSVPAPDEMPAEIIRRQALAQAGEWLPFAILRRADDRAIGMTNYLNLVEKAHRLEIGGTWIARSDQSTGVNVECKLLLLRHAFETLACTAVEFRTNSFNQQSRRAIEGLGAKLDGILRNHYDPGGRMRDTCVYSILPQEWPRVRQHLEWRLNRR